MLTQCDTSVSRDKTVLRISSQPLREYGQRLELIRATSPLSANAKNVAMPLYGHHVPSVVSFYFRGKLTTEVRIFILQPRSGLIKLRFFDNAGRKLSKLPI